MMNNDKIKTLTVEGKTMFHVYAVKLRNKEKERFYISTYEDLFDAEKVARIRQAVSDGTYRVNAEAIADRLLANAQDLLGKIGSGG